MLVRIRSYGCDAAFQFIYSFHAFIMPATTAAGFWVLQRERRTEPPSVFMILDTRFTRTDSWNTLGVGGRRYIEHSRGWTHKEEKSTIGTKCFLCYCYF